ncbi:MAG: universal stress protein [Candidatus Neomarinimicrobiota bacterium]|nr:MAG: universal stress protein [Candidatus Neomarinimicrobiota bacterium]
MLKRILIPLDPSPYTDNAIQIASLMGQNLGAELTGMVILDIPGIEKSIGPVPLGGLYYADKLEAQKEAEARARIDALLEKFRRVCEQQQVRYQEARVQGSPSTMILEESNFYDAVIMGMKTYYHFESQSGEGDSLAEILDHSITPVYAVPRDIQLPDLSQERIKVCIAFDGSFPSGRALQRFAQLALPDLMDVTLLTSQSDHNLGDHLLNQAEAYLQAHGFTSIQKVCTPTGIIKAIDTEYIDSHHLFVVGAHSKRGLFDFALGSLTHHLLKLDKRPVLIGQ